LAVATPSIDALAGRFVCVRVTDLRGFDLARYPLDFDLTFLAATATADGRILHRYGGRDVRDPEAFLSLSSFEKFLEASLETFKSLPPPAAGAAPAASRTIEASPSFRRSDAEKRVDCVHCHMIGDFRFRDLTEAGKFRPDDRFVFPDLARAGFEVARDQQSTVASVAPDGPAAKAGLRAGDRIASAGGTRIATRADLQWQLERAPPTATSLALEVVRDGKPVAATLQFGAGWKECDAREYAWRPFKWNLEPSPGFGGKALDATEKERLGLKPGAWALRVGYLVTWGEKADTGRAAQSAGLKKGDIVLSVAGESDFDSEEHFQAWFRFTQRPRTRIELVVLRDGKRRTLTMEIVG
jgi:hypothetical protein